MAKLFVFVVQVLPVLLPSAHFFSHKLLGQFGAEFERVLETFSLVGEVVKVGGERVGDFSEKLWVFKELGRDLEGFVLRHKVGV